jgi:universal stress protein E
LQAAHANVAPDAHVYLFHNVYHRNIIDEQRSGDQVLSEARELLLAARRERLEDLARRHFGARGHVVVVWSELGWPELVRCAVRNKCELVVAVSQRYGRLRRLSLSNEDWELIRHCPMPLLLVHGEPSAGYDRIVAAVDPLHADDKPADLDQRILEQAGRLARHHGARLNVLNVVAQTLVATPSAVPAALPAQSVSEEVLAAHRLRVDQLLQAAGTHADERLVVAAVPSAEIIDYARRSDADLLVMGAVSRSMLARLLIGNTAERVLDRVTCDVLVVKPGDFAERMPAMSSLLRSTASFL